MSRKNLINGIILLGIMILAFTLRVYKIGGVFHDIDSPILSSLVMENKNILWVLFHSYGYFTPLVSELFSRILLFLDIPITEFWWTLPISLIGTLTVLIVYFLIKLIFGIKKALFVSLIIGVLPVHIISSRYAYGYECGYVFLALLTVYLFIKYLKSTNKFNGILFSLALSTYILTHALFLFVFVILFWTAIVFTSERNGQRRSNIKLKNIFFNKIFILPGFCIFFEVIFTVLFLSRDSILKPILHNYFNPGTEIWYQTQTMLGHHILRLRDLYFQPKGLGFGEFFLIDLLSPWNIWLYLILFSIPFGIKDVRYSSSKSVFFVWGVLYLVPYIIIELLFDVGMTTYVSFGVVPMSIYTALFLYDKTDSILSYLDEKIKAIIFVLILSLMAFYMLLTSCYLVFSFDIGKYFNDTKKPFLDEPFSYRSSYYFDTGYKSAGYYIRKYVDNSKSIFIYNLDPEAAFDQYYFARKAYNLQHSDEGLRRWLEAKIDKIDIIITNPEFKGLIDAYLQFEIKSNIYSQSLNKERKLVLIVYGKKNISLPKIDMDTQKYNILYDKYYSFTGK